MKKLILAAAFTLAGCATTAAASNDEWELKTTVEGEVMAYSPVAKVKSSGDYEMGSYVNGDLVFYMYFEDGGIFDCDLKEYTTYKVNGQLVVFEQGCTEDKKTIYFAAKNKKGDEYIFQQFFKKDFVNVGGTVFSAKGFSKAVAEQRKIL